MGIVAFLVGVAVSGLFVGALGRLLLPGPDPMSIGETMLIGIASSFIAGVILWAVWGPNGGSFVLSVIIAVGLVALNRRRRGIGPGGGRPRLGRRY